MPELPVPLALLLADHVYQDRLTGKWIVAGVFSTVTTSRPPARQSTMDIFFQLTNVHGAIDLHLRLEHADGELVVLDLPGRITARSPLDVVSQKIMLRDVRFPKMGKYWVQLMRGEEIITQVPMYARHVQLRRGGDQPPTEPGDADQPRSGDPDLGEN